MTKFRTALLAAVATAALGGTAGANTLTPIAHNGLWETVTISAPDGTQAACIIRAHSADGWYLAIGAAVGKEKFEVHVGNPSFAAKTAKPAFSIQIDDYQTFNWQASGNQVGVYDQSFAMTINSAAAKEFVHEITAGTSMHITFDNGSTWDVLLAGTTPAWEAMMPCLKTVAPAAVASLTSGQATPVAVAAAAPAKPLGTPGEAPITWNGGGYDIIATLNDRPLNFTLDTGATSVLIPQNIADRLMADGSLSPADYLGITKVSLADGSTKTINRYMLKSVTVGGRTVENVEVSVGPPGASLLLGQSFLLRFKSWTTDNARGVLVLREPVV